MTGPTRVSAASVLVVDDEPAVRELLAQTFGLAGFEVITVAGGVAALNTVYSRAPDVVVLDMRLPDLDSRQVVRILREDGHDVPVVLLPKPFDLENVVTRVRQILGS
ncbi:MULTISPECIES: response regulator transcription factor [unclassified Streptomyces]|uniref:response regulator transcription factor n=1 Tax=unclassified Streptomyces TaxID=2593676 RepID=UPI0033AEE34E